MPLQSTCINKERILCPQNCKNVSDYIKNDYQEWTGAHQIIIDAPTGSGKTTFILETLLPYAFKNKKKVLYLCNRKILKEQVDNQISKLVESNSNYKVYLEYIEVSTYQKMEKAIINLMSNPNSVRHNYSNYYIVFDEAHYFFSDSTFNTNTILSLDYFLYQLLYQENYTDSMKPIFIFMSATIKNFLNSYERYYSWYEEYVGKIQKSKIDPLYPTYPNYETSVDINGPKMKIFKMSPDYSWINIKYFKDIKNDIPYIVCNQQKNSKWLIFVSSITEGIKIKESLETYIRSNNGDKKFKLDDIKFVSAKSNLGEENDIKEEISSKELFSCKILIATAFLDNGINLHDADLKNIIILSDNPESFIQMLGRKRKDSNSESYLNLYICSRDARFFNLKYKSITDSLNYFSKISTSNNSFKMAKEILCNDIFRNNVQKFIYPVPHIKYENPNISSKIWNYYLGNPDLPSCIQNYFLGNPNIPAHIKNYYFENPNIPPYIWNYYFDNPHSMYTYHINEFSVDNLRAKKSICEKMLDGFKTDKSIFIKEQLSWLNLESSYNEDNYIVESLSPEREKELRESIIKEMEKYKNSCPLSMEKKEEMCENLTPLVSKFNLVKKSHGETKSFSWKKINEFFKLAQIPYEINSISTSKKTKYEIRRLEECDQHTLKDTNSETT